MPAKTTSKPKTPTSERLSLTAFGVTLVVGLAWFITQALTYWS